MKEHSWEKFCFAILIPLGCILMPIGVSVFWFLFGKLDFLPGFVLFFIYLFLFLLFLLSIKHIPKKYYLSRGILYFLVGAPTFLMSIITFFYALSPSKSSDFDKAIRNECDDCAHIIKLVAENGEQLDVDQGIIIGKVKSGGWQDCSCGQNISYEKNSEYAVSQIEKMGDYWQHLASCSSYALYDYAEQTSFDLNGECYLHREKIRETAEVTFIYNTKVNQLLYLYYDW